MGGKTTIEIFEAAYDDVSSLFGNLPFTDFLDKYFEEIMYNGSLLTTHGVLKNDRSETFSLNIASLSDKGVPGHRVTVRYIAHMGHVVSNSYCRNFFPLSEGKVQEAVKDALNYYDQWLRGVITDDLNNKSTYFNVRPSTK